MYHPPPFRVLFLLAALSLGFAATALALEPPDAGPAVSSAVPLVAQAPLPDPETDPIAVVEAVFRALGAHQWGLLLALAVILITFAVRRYLPKLWPAAGPFLKSDPGAFLLTYLAAFAACLATSSSLSWPVVGSAAVLAFVASKKLLVPAALWVLKRLFPSPAEQAQEAKEEAADEAKSVAGSPEAAADLANKAIGR